MIISGFRGKRPGDPEVDRIRRYLEEGKVGGVILLKRNIASPEQLLALSRSLKEAAGPLAPLISIDQEGGRVARVSAENGFRDWMSAEAIARSGMSDGEVREYFLVRARELAATGVNLNFGPVVDLNVNSANPIIGAIGRSFAADASMVVRMAEQFVLAHHDVGVKTCLKHYPGHGSSTSDSHLNSVDIGATWSDAELLPFERLIAMGLADSVMMAHVYHPQFSDRKDRPVSLSAAGIAALRKRSGYGGPAITDDMQMGAITDVYPQDRAAKLALGAGNSFLIYSNYKSQQGIETAEEIGEAISLAAATGEMDPVALLPQYRRAIDFLAALT